MNPSWLRSYNLNVHATLSDKSPRSNFDNPTTYSWTQFWLLLAKGSWLNWHIVDSSICLNKGMGINFLDIHLELFQAFIFWKNYIVKANVFKTKMKETIVR